VRAARERRLDARGEAERARDLPRRDVGESPSRGAPSSSLAREPARIRSAWSAAGRGMPSSVTGRALETCSGSGTASCRTGSTAAARRRPWMEDRSLWRPLSCREPPPSRSRPVRERLRLSLSRHPLDGARPRLSRSSSSSRRPLSTPH
jgi:hypothetical protein